MTMKSPLLKKRFVQIFSIFELWLSSAFYCFTFFPNLAPQGYLGVDVFFVISGYLMAMIIGSKPLSVSLVINFYERRLKRLLPAYLLMIAATLLICSLVLIRPNYDLTAIDARYALTFVTNIQSLLEKQEYFQLVSEYKFFLHTWSLAVEVQFYIIAPFCLTLIAKNESKTRLICILVIIASAAFQDASAASPAVSFGLLPSRIWQFFIGVLVFHSESFLPEGFGCGYWIISFTVLSVIFFVPSKDLFSEQIKRLNATVITGAVIFFGPIKAPLHPVIARLHNTVLYIGNMSYSLYLVHWPIEILCRYLVPSFNRVYLLGGITIVAVIQYAFFESKLLKAPREKIFLICGLLTAASVAQSVVSGGVGALFKVEPKLAEQNIQISECKVDFKCAPDPEMQKYFGFRPDLEEFDICKFNGTGNHTIFVTGNSFATRQISAVFEALRNRYSNLYYYGRSACVLFEDVNDLTKTAYVCKDMNGKTAVFMKEIQPDIVVFIANLNHAIGYSATSYEAVKNESIVKQMRNYLDESILPYTKRFIHVLSHGKAPFNPPLELAKKYKNRETVNNFTVPFEPYAAGERYSTWRQLAAFENCAKCQIMDAMPAFCNNQTQTCELMDKTTGLSLFCNADHVSPYGAKKLIPLYDAALTRAIADIDGN